MRNYDARQRAYAEFVGAIEALDWQLYPAKEAVRSGSGVDDLSRAEIRESYIAMSRACGPIVMAAPSEIQQVLHHTTIPRARLARILMCHPSDHHADAGIRDEVQREWKEAQHAYRGLRERLRADLADITKSST
ncbi:MAG TPA: hypothetical protein VHU91_02295 [Mycobacteriales bacterium]|nr:hypothetical protein [Mycobacteriales bacterium]